MNVLYEYAAQYLGYHVCGTLIEEDLIFNLLRSKAKISAASQAIMASRTRLTRMTGVHVAAYFRLELAMMGLLNNRGDPEKVNINLEDACRRTPLSLAANNRHEAVVKLLWSHV